MDYPRIIGWGGDAIGSGRGQVHEAACFCVAMAVQLKLRDVGVERPKRRSGRSVCAAPVTKRGNHETVKH